MIAAAFFGVMPAVAGKPEALDAEFLDYLAACEGKDDNWTVVVDGKKQHKAADKAADEAPPKPAPPDAKPATPEARP
jgi:hypothetical protein